MPRLHSTTSKLPLSKLSDCPSATTSEAFSAPDEPLARPIHHGLRDVGRRSVAGRAVQSMPSRRRAASQAAFTYSGRPLIPMTAASAFRTIPNFVARTTS